MMKTIKIVEDEVVINKKEKPPKKKKLKKIILSTFLSIISIALVYAFFNIYIPYSNIKNDTDDIKKIFSSLKDDLENKDATQFDTKIKEARLKVQEIEKEVDSLEKFKSIPIAKEYLDNADKTLKIANHGFDITQKTLPSIEKTLTSMGYKTASNKDGKDLNEDQRLEGFMQELPNIANTYSDIEPDLLKLVDEIATLNPDFLPGGENVKQAIKDLSKNKDSYEQFSQKIKETLAVLPKLMGADGDTKYLIIFNNDNELRPAGGLISAYGFMDIRNGKIDDKIEANDSWFIQHQIWANGINLRLQNPSGLGYWMIGHGIECGGSEMRVQDSGVSPDNIINMQTFNKYYDTLSKYNPKEFPKYDAVIVITTDFASDLVKLIEPLEIPETKQVITSQNLAEEMSKETEKANSVHATGTKERKTFVKLVATALKDKVTKQSKLDILPNLTKTLFNSFQQKHIFLYSKDDELQNYFSKWGVTGEIEKNFDGDYLNISEAQICGLKSNLFVKDKVVDNINIKDDGSVEHNIDMSWENDKIPQKGQENILAFNNPYSAWVRLFVPKGSEVVSSKNGIYKNAKNYEDKNLNKDVIENLFQMRWRKRESDPAATYSLNFKYISTVKFNEQKEYKYLIQKHPGKLNETYTININYKGKVFNIDLGLDRDKVIIFNGESIRVDNFDTRLDTLITSLD